MILDNFANEVDKDEHDKMRGQELNFSNRQKIDYLAFLVGISKKVIILL